MSSLKRLFLFLSIVSALAIAFLGIFLRYRDDKMPCIFCDIAAKKSSTELVYEDENFVAFNDIKPASKFHFLVIPKKHIPNVKSLTLSDKEMVESMKRIMLEILASNNQTDMDQISLGFHMPPFNSIKHLHLHGISPKSDMRFIGRMIFRENSWWYHSADSVINSLPAES